MNPASERVLHRSQLPHSAVAFRFEGEVYGVEGLSFIWVEAGPGQGPRLHVHPYPEVFVIIEGDAVFHLGDESLEAQRGNIVLVPAHTPHRFVNTGRRPLRLVALHRSSRIVQDLVDGEGQKQANV